MIFQTDFQRILQIKINMKTTNNSITVPIKENKMKELLKETKEIIAKDIIKNTGTPTTFTIIDLWRVQKLKKTLGSSTKW